MWAKIEKNRGFTIVELLIVIVVIGVLAAITTVAFNGIQQRAKVSSVSSSLAQASKKIKVWQVDNASSSPADLATVGVQNAGDVTYQYSPGVSGAYCITATSGNVSYKITESSQPSSGGCAGHGQGGVSAVTNLAYNPRLATNTTAWGNQTPAGGSISRGVNDGPGGSSTYTVTTTASGPLRISFRAGPNGAIIPGEPITVSIDLYSSQAISNVGFEVFYGPGWTYYSFGNVTAGWNRYSISGVVPGSATLINDIQLISQTAVNSGSTFKATNPMVIRGSVTSAFADGSTPNWVWNGTPNNSTSTGPAI